MLKKSYVFASSDRTSGTYFNQNYRSRGDVFRLFISIRIFQPKTEKNQIGRQGDS